MTRASSDRPIDLLLSRLESVRRTKSGSSARCPAHDDHENSLSITEGDDSRALLKCFAGCSIETIVKALGLELRDLFPANDQRPEHPKGAFVKQRPITVDDLARDKGIPAEVLRLLGIQNHPGGVLIPYRMQDGSPAPRQRLRTALKANEGSRWLKGEGKPVPYGLWRLGDARIAGFLIIVEGESDCWTLWLYGFPALGIPGADMAGKLQAEHFAGIVHVYVLREPGQSGDTFVPGVTKRLKTLGWKGDLREVSLPDAKDPNELYMKDPERFKSAFQEALDRAQPLTLDEGNYSSTPAAVGGVEDLVVGSIFASLPAHPPLSAVEKALRQLAVELCDADPLRRKVAREASIRRLIEAGVRSPAGMVDAALESVRAEEAPQELQGRALLLLDPDPWPEQVDGAELLDQISATLSSYVVMGKEAADAQALWVIHTHALDATRVSPILGITSPQKRCGKSTNLEVLRALVRKPLFASNITAAALFRTVEEACPTLLIDEADSFLASSEELRGILNSGHTRAGAAVIRTTGEDFKPRVFSTWCPKVISCIGKLASTIEDRSIGIPLRRRRPDEHVQRLRLDRLAEPEPLQQKALRWVRDNIDALRKAEPEIPEQLHDRAQDNWRPLLAIAELAGGEWRQRARRAAVALSGSVDDGDTSPAVQLLFDIRDVFRDRQGDKITTEELLLALCAREDRPWRESRRGKPLSAIQLARLLKPFGIAPKGIRVGDSSPKGYVAAQFADAFARYLPPSDPQQPPQDNVSNELEAVSSRNDMGPVAAQGEAETPCEQRDVAGVAAQLGGDREGREEHSGSGNTAGDRERIEL